MPATTHLIYFSPTSTTKMIVERIAEGLGDTSVAHHDLTRLKGGLDLRLDDGLAVIGVPVYAGRVPEICLERLSGLSASGVPAVLVVLYGNRAFEDALIELRDVAVAKGFTAIAAGAFIGEHSYSTATQPIAAHRPDPADLAKAREFGSLIACRLSAGTGAAMPVIPGDVPYRERTPLGGVAPRTDPGLCTLCGTCATLCPTFVIRVDDRVLTSAEGCLKCCACTKGCPAGARTLHHPTVDTRREMLTSQCSERKEPAWFL